MNDKWDKRYSDLAVLVSSWSKDPSTQVGAVITNPNKTIASVGYNGFPAEVEDKVEWLQDRDEKLKRMLHAEHNALKHCSHTDVSGATIYVYPLRPCFDCAAKIRVSGIRRVVTVTTKEKYEYMHQPDVWERYKFAQTEDLFATYNIKHDLLVLN